MSRHLGDFDASAVVYGKFTTYRPSTGAPHTLAGSPALAVYKDNSTTQSTTGVTLTADFDSVTGLNHFAVDTSADGTFYSAGSFFDVVVTAGTVDSVSAVGGVVGSFTLRKTAALKPTTAGRTLDVRSGGEAGVDWANVGSPTTTLNLSGTTVKTATDVEADTQDVQARLPAALVSGRIDASVGAMASGVLTATAVASDALTAAKFAADVTTEFQNGLATAAALATAQADLDTITGSDGVTLATAQANYAPAKAGDAMSLSTTGLARLFTQDSGESYAAAVAGSVVKEIADNAGGASLTVQDIVDGVLDEALAGHATAGTVGKAVSDILDDTGTSGVAVSAAGVRAAVGLASANLDTQLDALPTATENADALLNRDMSAVSDTNARSPLNALRFLRNKWSLSGSTLSVTKENDTTTAWTATVSTDAAAEPVTGSDPA